MSEALEKPTFDELCAIYIISVDTLQHFIKTAGVSVDVLNCMLLSDPVVRADAVKVLAALSEHTARTFTLDTVDVPLMLEVQDG